MLLYPQRMTNGTQREQRKATMDVPQHQGENKPSTKGLREKGWVAMRSRVCTGRVKVGSKELLEAQGIEIRG